MEIIMKNVSTIDLHNQLDIYNKAIKSLSDGRNIYNHNDDLQRDGLIQRFEYCVELARKTAKLYLEYIGVENIISSPKEIIKLSNKYKIIHDEELRFDFISCRNRLSHIYSEPDSNDIFDFIESNRQKLSELSSSINSKIV